MANLLSRFMLCSVVLLSFTDREAHAHATATDPTLPVVLSCATLPELNEKFQSVAGWTGADGAYSIPLTSRLTLWTFGDTWIGRIVDGKRVDARMVNNSVARQNLGEKKSAFEFFWRHSTTKPRSVWSAKSPGKWFWPGDGAVVDGKLYMFLHREKKKQAKEPDFGFAADGDWLIRIDNPSVEPTNWKVRFQPLRKSGDSMQFGSACIVENDYFYSFCSYAPAQQGLDNHPLILARIHKDKLARLEMNGWEYFCHSNSVDSNAQEWLVEPIDPVILFPDAAAEMTVSTVKGVDGYIATYCPAGFGPDIVIRHARHIEGPWGPPVKIYHCPEDLDKTYIYSAKAHPELAENDGQIIVTYCRNTKFFADQLKHPEVYLPQAILVNIKL